MKTESIKIILEDEFRKQIHSVIEKYKLQKRVKERVKTPSENYSYFLDYLLKFGVELTSKTHAALFRIISKVNKNLQINPALRVFKAKQGGGENAYMVSYGNLALLVFDEDILNLIGDNPDELKFLIGHELGHFIYKHTEDSYLNYILKLSDPRIKISKGEETFFSKEGEKNCDLAYLTSQIAELNADRIGLIACQNFEASALAAVKLSGGNFDHYGYYDTKTFLGQAEELLKSEGHFTIEDIRDEHPYMPLRVYALEKFYSSIEFNKGKERKNRQEQMNSSRFLKNKESTEEKLINEVLPLHVFYATYSKTKKLITEIKGKEPKNYKVQKSKTQENKSIVNTNEFKKDLFLFIASIYVVTSAGNKVSRSESDFLLRIIRNKKHLGVIMDFNQNVDDDEVERKYLELVPFAKTLPVKTKTAIIKNLIKAAKVDRRIDDEEIDMILQIAGEIGAWSQAKKQMQLLLGIEIL